MPHSTDQLIARLRRNPEDTEAFRALRSSYEQSQDFASLANLLEGWAARQSMPNASADAFCEAADVIDQRLGDTARAVRALQHALRRFPTHAGAAQRLQPLLETQGRLDELTQILDQHARALAEHGVDPKRIAPIHYKLGQLSQHYYQSSEHALAQYRYAFELDPALLEAIYDARQVCLDSGDLQLAASLYDAEANAEGSPERRVSLRLDGARLRADRLGQVDEAISTVRHAYEEAPHDVTVMHELAGLLVRRADEAGDVDPAQARRDRHQAAELYTEIAARLDGEEAIGYAQAALALAPEHDGALGRAEEVASGIGREDVLPPLWVAYLQAAPDGPHVAQRRLWLATAYSEAGQIDDAIYCLEPLAASGDAEARRLMASLYTAAGRPAPEYTDTPARQQAEPLDDDVIEALPDGGPADAPQPARQPGDPSAHDTARPPARATEMSRLEQLRHSVRSLQEEGRRDEAARRAEEVLELAPNDPEATDLLASHYREARRFEPLRDLLARTAELPGVPVEARKERLAEVARLCESELKDVEGALQARRALVALDPDDADAAHALRKLLREHARWDELIGYLNRAVIAASDPEQKAELLREIATLHHEQREDPRAAAEAYRQLHALRPEDRRIRDLLCDAYLQAGEPVAAIPFLQQRVEESESREERHRLLKTLVATLTEHTPDDTQALYAACAKQLELEPGSLEALDHMERIDAAEGRYEQLLDVLQRRAFAVPHADRVPVFQRMADIAERQLDDPLRAAELLGHARDLDPDNPELLDRLIDMLERGGLEKELLQVLRRRVQLEEQPSKRLPLHRRIAQLLTHREGDSAAAEHAWQDVLALHEDPEGLTFLRRVAVKRDDPEALSDALRRLANVTEAADERRALRLEHAELLSARLRRPEQAVETLRAIVADEPPDQVATLKQIASLQEHLGDQAGLADTWERTLQVTSEPSERAELATRLADLYEHRLNDAARAIQALQRLREAKPGQVDTLRRLRALLEAQQAWEPLVDVLDGLARHEEDEDRRGVVDVECARVLVDKLERVDEAWSRLATRMRRGDRRAEEALHDIASRTRRHEALAGLYIELAQQATDPAEQAAHWEEVARIYHEELGTREKALEALLRRLATNMDNRGFLADVEEAASEMGAWPRLEQVYTTLLKRNEDPHDKVELLLRQSELLERKAGDPSAALDRVLRALALQPLDPALLELAERLAPEAGRAAELLQVYDRRRARVEEPSDQIDMLLRAATLCFQTLEDQERGLRYLEAAVPTTRGVPELVERVEQAARAQDETTAGRAAREAFARACREMGEVSALEGGDAAPWVLRAVHWLRAELQDDDAAFEALREATERQPADARLVDALEELARDAGRLDALDRHLVALADEVVDSATSAGLLWRRARLLEATGEHATARDVYAKLLQMRPDDTEAAERLAASLREAGRHQDLLVLLDRRLKRSSGAETRLPLLKEIATVWEQALRNQYEALDAWKRVLAEDPDDAEAAQAVERLRRQTRPPRVDESALFEDDDAKEPVPRAAPLPQEAHAAEQEAHATKEAHAVEERASAPDDEEPPPVEEPPDDRQPPPAEEPSEEQPPARPPPEEQPPPTRETPAPTASPAQATEAGLSDLEMDVDSGDTIEELDLEEVDDASHGARAPRSMPPPVPGRRRDEDS